MGTIVTPGSPRRWIASYLDQTGQSLPHGSHLETDAPWPAQSETRAVLMVVGSACCPFPSPSAWWCTNLIRDLSESPAANPTARKTRDPSLGRVDRVQCCARSVDGWVKLPPRGICKTPRYLPLASRSPPVCIWLIRSFMRGSCPAGYLAAAPWFTCPESQSPFVRPGSAHPPGRTWARVPMQLPMIQTALRSGRSQA
jgi:hypothetical protein